MEEEWEFYFLFPVIPVQESFYSQQWVMPGEQVLSILKKPGPLH